MTEENMPETETVEMETRPEGLPDKFWDDEKGGVRLSALSNSYQELERAFGAREARNEEAVPESAAAYEIESPMEILSPDEGVNQRLFEAGFSNDQAQLVYNLAAETLMPLASEMAAQFEADNQIERLAGHFGGKEKWSHVAGQIETWGKANFPDDVFAAMASSYDGVLALHRMMTKGEPGLIEGANPGGGALSEAGLKEMMRDPRYWRDGDPGFVGRVRDGFKTLFPGEG